MSALAEPAFRTVANPKGNGDPDAITCRTPRDIGGPSLHIRHYGPEVCATNKVWAELIQNHITVVDPIEKTGAPAQMIEN
jgi:hypothetical protein